MNSDKMIKWIGTRRVGVSSRTMWCALMGTVDEDQRWTLLFDVPHDAQDFARCYDLVSFCELTPEDLQRVTEIFPYYKPIVDEWDRLTEAFTAGRRGEVFDILKSKRAEIQALKELCRDSQKTQR